MTDSREAISPGAGCVPASGGVLCAGANRIFVALGDGNDTLTNIGSLPTRYLGGNGDGVLASGTGVDPSQVTFDGNPGRDTVSYAAATRGVTVDLDGFAADGRTGVDRDNVRDDVEVLQGTGFADKRRTASSTPPGTGSSASPATTSWSAAAATTSSRRGRRPMAPTGSTATAGSTRSTIATVPVR